MAGSVASSEGRSRSKKPSRKKSSKKPKILVDDENLEVGDEDNDFIEDSRAGSRKKKSSKKHHKKSKERQGTDGSVDDGTSSLLI